MFSVKNQHSDPYTATGLTRALYNFILVYLLVLLTKRYSGDQIKKIWARRVAYKGERRDAYRVLVGKPDRKKLLGRSRQRWEDTSSRNR